MDVSFQSTAFAVVEPGLLSQKESERLARPLVALSHKQQERVAAVLNQAHGQWLCNWSAAFGLDVPTVGVSLRSGAGESLQDRTPMLSVHMLHLLWGPTAPSAVSKIFPSVPLATRVAELAASAWESCIEDVLGRQGESLDPAAISVAEAAGVPGWDGSLLADFAIGHAIWTIRLSPSEVLRLAGPPMDDERPAGPSEAAPSPTPLVLALANSRVTVQVELAPLELTIGELESLRMGDVVVLDHALDEPAVVRSASHATRATVSPTTDALCSAWLGRSGTSIAAELHAVSR